MSFTFTSEFQSSFQTISSFGVPYVSRISGGLKAGKAVFIQGSVPSGCESFVVNLKCGESKGDDIALQIKPLFSSDCMVLNSRQHGSWGEEEKMELALKQGTGFDLMIAVNTESYQVHLNGREVGAFQHRISLGRVIALSIEGEVSLTNVAFTESWDGCSVSGWSECMLHSQDGTITSEEHSSVLDGSFTVQPQMGFSLSNPVQNPNLPYVAPISGGLREGMALFLKGVVPTKADRFELNFKTGPSGNDDIAFHFNPRMDRKVAMNSFRNRGWQAEESVSDNPFKKGQPFEMLTAIKSEGYQVYVNGKELYTFKHRVPLEKVSTLNISGDVAVDLSGFIQNWNASSFVTKVKSTTTYLGRPHGKRSTAQSEILQPVQNPNLPYVAPISGGLREGMALYLQGVVPTNADKFEVNFKTGESRNDDIAFHFNPRMDRKVAMNSFRNRGWQAEESVSNNPFKKGQPFEMLTAIKSEGYQVYVNGKELYTFKHRVPLEKVSTINISGDVAVDLSGFIQNWRASVFPTKVTTKITNLGSSPGERSTVQAEILQPVQNPNLPYVAPVSGGLREGMALFLKGVVPTKADRFEINFKTGPSSNDDFAFHFNPRMDKNVAMNSVINGNFGTEESVSDNPFKKGQPFEMLTAIKSEGYQVYVNGKELYTFKHRIPLEKVSTINISGDVAVDLSGFIQNWRASVFPTKVTTKITNLGSSPGERSTVQAEILQPVQNPNLPYVAPISGGLREGMALFLKGVVPTKADRFEINFKTGPSSNDDFAFHFNPRMDKNVAMNSVINGNFGTEESVSDNP
ncbi:uncharacterized protein LOC122335718, partial [Puntigrus tetrazona]|uniref:uncharacterized protein LOC122335718 n=1 Tax=Puntigrus tetrazona TaxID=1606681 RepID=UPI001C899AAA